MSLRDSYKYEIEIEDGTIIIDHNNFDKNKVIRVSYLPSIVLLPRHDIIFKGFKFKKRFSRVTMGWNSIVKECLHCVVTDRFRVYLRSTNGQIMIVHKDYELKL